MRNTGTHAKKKEETDENENYSVKERKVAHEATNHTMFTYVHIPF